ncbi:hypothetical protein AGLY_009409 [Aphis glycines]|uniref:Uncharacterized protein n=1 Tax=Aphis glycines TaxID=307491 RepID=A0A6G0THZ2_APHGL|nr:hypothetical protein AGLY_009409 [Aphis glycines]
MNRSMDRLDARPARLKLMMVVRFEEFLTKIEGKINKFITSFDQSSIVIPLLLPKKCIYDIIDVDGEDNDLSAAADVIVIHFWNYKTELNQDDNSSREKIFTIITSIIIIPYNYLFSKISKHRLLVPITIFYFLYNPGDTLVYISNQLLLSKNDLRLYNFQFPQNKYLKLFFENCAAHAKAGINLIIIVNIQTQPQVASLYKKALLRRNHSSQIEPGKNLGVPNKNVGNQAT